MCGQSYIESATTLSDIKFILLKPIGSFDKTGFMTVLDIVYIKVRQLVIQGFSSIFFQTEEQKSIGLAHNSSVRNLRGTDLAGPFEKIISIVYG